MQLVQQPIYFLHHDPDWVADDITTAEIISALEPPWCESDGNCDQALDNEIVCLNAGSVEHLTTAIRHISSECIAEAIHYDYTTQQTRDYSLTLMCRIYRESNIQLEQ